MATTERQALGFDERFKPRMKALLSDAIGIATLNSIGRNDGYASRDLRLGNFLSDREKLALEMNGRHFIPITSFIVTNPKEIPPYVKPEHFSEYLHIQSRNTIRAEMNLGKRGKVEMIIRSNKIRGPLIKNSIDLINILKPSGIIEEESEYSYLVRSIFEISRIDDMRADSSIGSTRKQEMNALEESLIHGRILRAMNEGNLPEGINIYIEDIDQNYAKMRAYIPDAEHKQFTFRFKKTPPPFPEPHRERSPMRP